MSDSLDPLATFDAELAERRRLVCPVCRLDQDIEIETCGRCGADLALLSHTLQEAEQHRGGLYRAVFANEAVVALGHLDSLVQLVGPSVELAVLRKLLKFGTVPVEVAHEILLEHSDELLEVYEPAAPGELDPPVESDEQAAFAELSPEPAPESEPEPEGEPEPQPESEPVVTAATDWMLPTLAVALALAFGLAIGRVSSRPEASPAPTAERRTIEWNVAPLPAPAEATADAASPDSSTTP